jgi:hypothetical protein
MLSDPIKFFDGLIQGIVLTFYNVVALSAASLVFPFVRKTRQFWPTVLSINRRVSSLTLLLIWQFVFYTLAEENILSQLVARVASNRDAGSKLLQITAAAVIGTVLVDIALRLICLGIKPIRRSLYRELLRISVAGAFFLSSGLMLIGKDSLLFSRLGHLLTETHFGIPDITWKLFLSGLSISIIAAKGFGIRSSLVRASIALSLASIVPWIVVVGSALAGLMLEEKMRPLVTQREPTPIVQSNTRCVLTKATEDQPPKLKVITFLKLDGEFDKSAVLPLSKLVVERGGDKGGMTTPVGKFENDGSEIILSNAAFNRFEFLVEFVSEDNKSVASKTQFSCWLALLGGGPLRSNRRIEDRTVDRWQ